MADNKELPKLMVMKPAAGNRYAGYTEGGDVFCQEESAFSPLAKIEVERAEAGGGKYVHLRFYHSNKYWARGSGPGVEDNWIVAVSNQPEEDTSKSSCTLFEPTYFDGLLHHLTHVQSGRLVRTNSESNRVYVDDDGDAFSFVDWDKLVKIPKRVTFKVAAKYLEAVGEGTGELQFSGSDGKSKKAAFVVHLHPDGHLRIQSEFLGKFWRRSSPDNWILADTTDTNGVDTLFWPKKVDSRTIALLSNIDNANSHFCGRMSKGTKVHCLNAAAAVSQITNEARLVVEEPLLRRSISGVQYRTQDSRVFDEKPDLLLGTGSAHNPSDRVASVTVTFPYQDAPSYYFTNDFPINTGVQSLIQACIPRINDDGIIVISPDVEVTIDPFQWGTTCSPKKPPAEIKYTVRSVPPKGTATVKYLATLGNCSVPFCYTQNDDDGIASGTNYTDGIFHGEYYYSYHFDISVQMGPLPPPN